ncbi:SpoIIE family protein phosphatase [Streptomyces sp. H10-C2]|uniref:ATP-binding SpoIIE family protein phosphatase n=1 Tax=unclassified Streptomyces TaxID=2593676 RepID=UPI0024B8C651|nr:MULTISPECIES: SpoIIE family protein phosphatase [unclassified Streptomyces]MDJ0340315.1 SpoIIE family protein phosphatase [Streptomyces sp. PH10-H1]MDJ0368237.1 SpoIIE family protein phosphatase [Streptomyces sp. H10-C2]
MRTEDVLAAVGTGLWHWDETAGTVALDATAARLLGLPAEPGTSRSSAVRACLHAEDFVALNGALALARAEGTVLESQMRVVGDDGSITRTIRLRMRPSGRHTMAGTLHEARGAAPGGPAPAGDWRRAREAFLLDAGRALAEADSTAEVLRVAATLSMPGFSPDGLAVFGVQGDRLSVIGHHGHAVGADGPFMDMPMATDYPAALVVRTGRAIYLPTAEAYEQRFPVTWPLAEPFGRSSWAFLPLVVAGSTIGAWMAAFREPVGFTPDERSVLTTVARMLAQALSRAHLHESERELSDGLQRTMLPTRGPDIDGMAVAARYVPTGGGLQVGGDWYDVIGLPSGRTALVIGDVQGHDVRAAGLMGQLRIALRAYAAEGHHPDAVLSRTSRFLAGLTDPDHRDDDRFATCLYLEADPATGTLDVVRAGHPEPAIRLGDGTTIVRRTAGGMPLGIAPDSDYPTTRLVLEPGETLLICTDGLIETGGHDLGTGWKRLRAALETGPSDDLEALADHLVGAVHGPASHHTTGPLADRREDDIALMLLRRDPDGPSCAVPVRRTVLTVSQSAPRQIRESRHEIRALLHDWAAPDQVDAAVLLVSELITNVLVHTDEDAVLTARLMGMPGTRRLRIDVGDRSDDMPHRRSPGEMASSGRGLLLIEELADAWGVDPRGDGKTIWFEIYEAAAVG